MARLFIPGPTDVHPQVLAAQTRAMIGHRSQACEELMGRIQPRLRQVFKTAHRVFLTASSGSGLQEAAVRNCVNERLLVCVCGAFSERWYEVALANGVAADRLDVPWGQANSPQQVAATLQSKSYDAVAVVHNETSTGVENPIQQIAAAARAVKPEILILVDAVSSAGGVDIETDAWGLDLVLTSSQKCFALPPGLAFAAVSDAALERARRVPSRGWYFDFVRLDQYLQKNTTPATPAISLLYALDLQLDRMLAEGMPARFERHRRMADTVQRWAADRFDLFAAPGARSKTVTTIRNTRGFEIKSLEEFLAAEGMTIADGYGPLKGKTFRIAHMGEIQEADVHQLLAHIDRYLGIPPS
jgi:predicted phosphoserine aminotransferase